MSKYYSHVLAAALSVLTTACGGGGGGSDGGGSIEPEPPVIAPPVVPGPELFRITGTVTASTSQAVDGDTNNDSSATVRPNDTVGTAQTIANPITLGGYVNLAGTGAAGRSYLAGDREDYFRVDLLAGQSITMLVADFEQADADLYLYDALGTTTIAVSADFGEIENIVIPRDGSYIVNVSAYEGATNYVLAIGNQNNISGRSQGNFDIVPWEAVIKYREAAEPEMEASGENNRAMRRMGMQLRAGGRGRARLLAMRRGLADGDPEIRARLGPAHEKITHFDNPELRERWETLLAIKTLRREPQVEYAEPNYQVRAMSTPDDAGYQFQWHYPLIDLPSAWDTTTGNPGIIVAVIDTGVLMNHPDLQGQWVAGYDFVRNIASARDGDGIDPDPEDPGDPASSSFHGTHVSGTVAAAGNNGIGVAGVAYDARVMPLRALGADGSGTTYDVDQAIRFAAGLPNDSGTVPTQRADIINLSLGGAPFSQASQDLYQRVREEGIAIVASAGNEASSIPSYPASYQGVISVAAVDAQRQRASYSNTGNFVDVAAPGGNNGADLNGDGYPDGVLSTGGIASSGDFGYTFLSGTSMAAPHVSGILALMKSVNPDLDPADIDALLARGDISDDLGTPGRDDQYGHGLINAQRAVAAALAAGGNHPADNPLLSASAGTLNFSGGTDTLELELRNAGGGELELLELSGSEPWLRISPVGIVNNGLGLYQVTVDRNGLATGVYAADIVARSSVNMLTVRVIMSVGDAAAADVGTVYILLYEQDANEPIAQATARAVDGRYAFTFRDIPPGDYRIFAGSDADNDLLICDSGEACGAWLTIDQPITIQLDSDIELIDFPVDYLIAIPNTANTAGSGQPPQLKSREDKSLPRLTTTPGGTGEE